MPLSRKVQQVRLTWDLDGDPIGSSRSSHQPLHPSPSENTPLAPILTSSNLKRLLDTMAQAILGVDQNGKVFVWNPACERLFGITRHKALRRDVSSLLPAGPLVDHIMDTVDGGREISNLEVLLTVNGEDMSLLLDTRHLRDRSHRLIGILAVLTDVTRMRAQELQIKLYENMVLTDKIIAGLAHEVRNPLTSIRGFAQLLLEGNYTGDNPKKYLQSIIAEADKLSGLIQGFISLEMEQPETEVVDIGELVMSAVRIVQGYAKPNGIHIAVVPGEESAYVDVSLDQIQQVLLTILQNALASSQERGAVKVATVTMEHNVVITITCTNRSLPQGQINAMLDNLATGDGRGLGMPMSRSIMRRHGGDIRINQDAGGTTVATIILPRLQAISR